MLKKPNPKANDFCDATTDLCTLTQNALAKAKTNGASSAEIAINKTNGFEVSVRKQEIETIEYHRSKELGITVYFGNKSGTAVTTDFNETAINLVVEKACYIARYTSEDLYAGLAAANLMAYNYPDLDLYHPWDIDIERAIELALTSENYGFLADKRIVNSEGCAVTSLENFRLYANTHGFLGKYPSSMHNISCLLIAEANGQMQADYEYTAARDAKDLEAAKILGQKTAKKTVKKLGAKSLTTRECPVIFLAPVAKSLISSFIRAISGENLYNKTTFLLDHLEEKIFPDFIDIDERPLLKNGYGSTPFDNEGVITNPRFFIEKGYLKSYVLNSYAARKLGMQTTGNAGGVHNLFVSCGKLDLSELLKLMHSGLLITDLLGQGINLVTGDYSRGAFGFWVENGKIQYPVENITVASNLHAMFANIVAVGNDIDARSNIKTGSILINNIKIAGI